MSDAVKLVELRRAEARAQYKLTERQLWVLESAAESLSGKDWQSLHDVFTALARKGFVAFKKPTASAQARGYSVTQAGYEIVRPIQIALAARRLAADEEQAARFAAEEEVRARRELKLDGSTYDSDESIDDAIRRELGIDKILASAEGSVGSEP